MSANVLPCQARPITAGSFKSVFRAEWRRAGHLPPQSLFVLSPHLSSPTILFPFRDEAGSSLARATGGSEAVAGLNSDAVNSGTLVVNKPLTVSLFQYCTLLCPSL